MSGQGACILSSDGPRLTADERALFREADPVGVILFARHIETPDQVRALTAEMRESVGRDCPILIDQEGGRVQRIGPPTWRGWRPPLDHAEAASDPARAMYLRARLIAHELHALGIDTNCAPTLDIAFPDTHVFLRNRCYGTDPESVATLGRATADGLLAGGVLPVMKHMPGHGRSLFDTHFDLPTVETPHETLRATDFAPFEALRDLPMGMTGHLVFSALDTAVSTCSAAVIGAIRDEIGFDGLLMSDDISMQALSGDLADRSRAAIAAGCDVVLHCNDAFPDRVAVAGASGTLSPEAERRVQAALAARRPPDDIDIARIEAELEMLLDGQVYV